MSFSKFGNLKHLGNDYSYSHFLKDFIHLFLERKEGREKEGEKNINVWLPLMPLTTGDLACNPGMCPKNQTSNPLVHSRHSIH